MTQEPGQEGPAKQDPTYSAPEMPSAPWGPSDSQPYSAPDQSFGAPPPPYGAPEQPYGTPDQSFGAPPPPYGAPEQPYGTPDQSFGAPPQPYGAQQPYGAPPPPYGAQQPYGAPPPPYGAQPYGFATASPTPTSALILTILAAMETLSCYFTLAGLPPLIIGIVALTRNTNDPQGASRLAKIGWIVFAALNVLVLIGIIVFFVWVATVDTSY